MLTRHGVCYDLEKSPFVYYVSGYELRFSSGSHLDKFKRDWQAKVDWLNDSMSNRFRFNVELDELALLNTYRQVETRGFYVAIEGKVARCPENITFRGLKPSVSA